MNHSYYRMDSQPHAGANGAPSRQATVHRAHREMRASMRRTLRDDSPAPAPALPVKTVGDVTPHVSHFHRHGRDQQQLPPVRADDHSAGLQPPIWQQEDESGRHGSLPSSSKEEEHVTLSERKVAQGKARFGVTQEAIVLDSSNDEGRPFRSRIAYLEGVRGYLAFCTFLAVFFRIFAPAIATDMDEQGNLDPNFVAIAPAWHSTLRKALSPIAWDQTLIPHAFIILSGRVVVNTYLERRNALPLAGAALKRPMRLLPVLMVSLALTSVLTATGAFSYANSQLSTALSLNPWANAAPIWSNTIEYFNSLVAYFFAEQFFGYYDRPFAFVPPAGILWVMPIIFQQTYTCITAAYLLPYGALRPKLLGGIFFILLCFWTGSWAWYSLSGLALAEFAIVYVPMLPASGIRIGQAHSRRAFHVPYWLPGLALTALGILLKYLWASFPNRRNDEYWAHADLNNGNLVKPYLNSALTPYPRIDDWCVVVGFLYTLEVAPLLQKITANFPLVHLGRLAFGQYRVRARRLGSLLTVCVFTAIACFSGPVMLSMGTRVDIALIQAGMTNDTSRTGVLFAICLASTVAVSELVHWTLDLGSFKFALATWRWLRKPRASSIAHDVAKDEASR